MKYPTITAVMVTMGRMDLIRESLKCFQDQTYPAKKLLIVTDCDAEKHEELEQLPSEDHRITVLHVGGPQRTLGELRNLSIQYASNLSIQWDDDDWFGPTRIMDQWRGLGKAKAVMLTEQLHYFRDTGQVAWVVDPRGIEGTVLLDRRCGLKYPAERRGEDTVLKKALRQKGLLNLISGGISYCRTYHGDNTRAREHHIQRLKRLGKRKEEIDNKQLVQAAKLYKWRKNWKPIYKE